jgi:hypothetical protein
MVETPEIPEANNHFERRVALTIAIMAVVLAVISMKGDNAKGDGLLAATKASSQWAYFQAKSIKEHSYELQKETLKVFPSQASIAGLIETYDKKIENYTKEKDEIKKQADALEGEVISSSKINDRCDLGGLLLQIGIVICSIAILVEWPLFWIIGSILGILGTITGATAYFL